VFSIVHSLECFRIIPEIRRFKSSELLRRVDWYLVPSTSQVKKRPKNCALHSFELSVTTDSLIWCSIQGDCVLQRHYCEDLRSGTPEVRFIVIALMFSPLCTQLSVTARLCQMCLLWYCPFTVVLAVS